MKSKIIIFLLLLGLIPVTGYSGGSKVNGSAPMPNSSDPKLTPLALKLYKYLMKISGTGLIFGHQDVLREGHKRPAIAHESDVQKISGKWPGMMGLDFREPFKWPQVYWESYKNMIKTYHDMGGIVTLSWHMDNPVSKGNVYEKTPAVRRMLPGGDKHGLYLQWLDKLAQFFKELKGSKGESIPILWRPFHEFNGDWFWWSMTDRKCENLCFITYVMDHYSEQADRDFVKLFQFSLNYLRRVKSVHSILVVYSPGISKQGFDYLWRYPGDNYVDVMAFDKYVPNLAMVLPHLQRVVAEAKKKGKVAALAETGLEGVTRNNYWTEDFLNVIKNDPVARKLSYAMVWRNSGTDENHFFAPYPGHASVPSFQRMEIDSYSLFLEDMSVYK